MVRFYSKSLTTDLFDGNTHMHTRSLKAPFQPELACSSTAPSPYCDASAEILVLFSGS